MNAGRNHELNAALAPAIQDGAGALGFWCQQALADESAPHGGDNGRQGDARYFFRGYGVHGLVLIKNEKPGGAMGLAGFVSW